MSWFCGAQLFIFVRLDGWIWGAGCTILLFIFFLLVFCVWWSRDKRPRRIFIFIVIKLFYELVPVLLLHCVKSWFLFYWNKMTLSDKVVLWITCAIFYLAVAKLDCGPPLCQVSSCQCQTLATETGDKIQRQKLNSVIWNVKCIG